MTNNKILRVQSDEIPYWLEVKICDSRIIALKSIGLSCLALHRNHHEAVRP
jgi:hypothetical protein